MNPTEAVPRGAGPRTRSSGLDIDSWDLSFGRGQVGDSWLLRTLSSAKWVSVSLPRLLAAVQNGPHVVGRFLMAPSRGDICIRFRDGTRLTVPPNYPFQSIVETLLLNAYLANPTIKGIVIDVGASVGDFVLKVANFPSVSHIYAFEPNPSYCNYLRKNVRENNLDNVTVYQEPATRTTIDRLFDTIHPKKVAFLKVDCEGCEYGILCPPSPKLRQYVSSIHAEVHPGQAGLRPANLARALRAEGYAVWHTRSAGCPYIHAAE